MAAAVILCLAGCARRPPAAAAFSSPETPRPAFTTTAPAVATPREIRIGDSVGGRPITLYLFGDGENVATLVLAAIHGDEPSAAFVGRRLVAFLGEHPEAAGGQGVAVVPIANPDGVEARTRTNARDIDVNRNFPAANFRPVARGRNSSGPSAASEPETRALVEAVTRFRPRRVVSIHSPLRCNNYDGPPRALDLAQLMASHNGYPVRATVGYATPGSFGSWAGVDQGIPVVTLELPPHTPGERAWKENQEALLAVIRAPT